MLAGSLKLLISDFCGRSSRSHGAAGFKRFHVVGHDRGGRTGHRMALDHPAAVLTLTVMDIVPTYAMFMDTNRKVAGLLALVLSVTAWTISGATDRQRSRFLL